MGLRGADGARLAVLQAVRDGLHRHIEVPLLLRLLSVPPDARVLEIGCGTGIALEVMRRGLPRATIVGIDLAVSGCSVAGAAEALPIADASADLVVDFGVVQHAPDPSLVLAEIARVLRPGGRYVCETTGAQVLAHPLRPGSGRQPWPRGLVPERHLGLWQVRRRA